MSNKHSRSSELRQRRHRREQRIKLAVQEAKNRAARKKEKAER